MRPILFTLGLLTAGCGGVDYDTRVPQVTEFTVAPDDPRYNQPRELEYRPPPPKKEFKPGLGAPGTGGMGTGFGQ